MAEHLLDGCGRTLFDLSPVESPILIANQNRRVGRGASVGMLGAIAALDIGEDIEDDSEYAVLCQEYDVTDEIEHYLG